jgi:hypothetical protein
MKVRGLVGDAEHGKRMHFASMAGLPRQSDYGGTMDSAPACYPSVNIAAGGIAADCCDCMWMIEKKGLKAQSDGA